jgi:hypothetical protein
VSQTLNLSVSGIYTSLNDYNGLPPGALDAADNLECRYKNVLEPRRGFDGLPDSEIALTHFVRLTNFWISGDDKILGLSSDGDLVYYNGAGWSAVPGDYSTDIVAPDETNGKSRFVQAGQNLYLTAQDGVRSLSSGSSAEILRAGVPKGLNLQAETNGDSSGFFSNNSVITTTGTVTNGSALITNVDDSTGVEVGQYVSGTDIPSGTTVSSITESATVLVTTGNSSIGSTSLTSVASITGLSVGMLVSGTGIPEGARIATAPAGTTVVLDVAVFQTATGSTLTFSSAVEITMSQNATGSHTGQAITFYSGAQVGYRMVFGRVETDINGGTITRLGAPSSIAIALNTSSTSTNVTVTGTLPKNSDNEITFVQLYRSPQTDSIDITPLDQYNLVYERELEAADFTARVVTITDDVPDSLVGIPLYAGSDREGILQANDPPPMCWDMCRFRDFALYGNITLPTSLRVTIVSVGAPSGIQVNDTITISGTFLGVAFTETYTAKSAESAAAREFKVFSSGTPSQNIADTANSLIRVINYDNSLPVHAILLSTSTDLPGQILFEADNPGYDTFTATASAHTSAYDPALSNLESEVNTINNGIAVSKTGELEAVPTTNLLRAGDTSSEILRVIPLRDYVIVLKTDGIYKVQGLTPASLVINPFDLTTKIIGAETAVSLNSGVWMLSNQGVVSISDGGVDAKSIPIDDQLNRLIGSYLDNLTDVAFAVGYESDRKYILFVPTSDNAYAEVEYNFNYTTNCWTTWSRNFYAAFVHSNEGKLYVSRADANDQSVSKERKQATYKDFVDEGLENTITSVDTFTIGLNSMDDVEEGDILYQDETHFSPILEVDLINSTVTVQYDLSFTVGAVSILKAYLCAVTWKQVFADNPAFVKQFSEGVALFKNTRFNEATARFVTDFSQSVSDVELTGTGNALWGLFPWGEVPWGGTIIPSKIRFYIPQDKQLGSYLLPSLRIKQGYSDFKFQGLAIAYYPVSQEVGL